MSEGTSWTALPALCADRWGDGVRTVVEDPRRICHLHCRSDHLVAVSAWLFAELGFAFATLIVEEGASESSLTHIFQAGAGQGWAMVHLTPAARRLDRALDQRPGARCRLARARGRGPVRAGIRGPSPSSGSSCCTRNGRKASIPCAGASMPASRWPCASSTRNGGPRPSSRRRAPSRCRSARFFGLCRGRTFPARDGRRGRDRHDPALLLQIPGGREDRRGPGSRPRPASRRALFRQLRLRPWPGLLPGARDDLRRPGAGAGAGPSARCSPSSSGSATTRRRSPASAPRPHSRWRPPRPRSSRRTCCA